MYVHNRGVFKSTTGDQFRNVLPVRVSDENGKSNEHADAQDHDLGRIVKSPPGSVTMW